MIKIQLAELQPERESINNKVTRGSDILHQHALETLSYSDNTGYEIDIYTIQYLYYVYTRISLTPNGGLYAA